MSKVLLFFYVILAVIFVGLVIGFAQMNDGQMVAIKFLGLRVSGEFWAFSLLSIALGFILGWFVCFFSGLKYRMRSRQLDKKLAKAEKKLQLGDVTDN